MERRMGWPDMAGKRCVGVARARRPVRSCLDNERVQHWPGVLSNLRVRKPTSSNSQTIYGTNVVVWTCPVAGSTQSGQSVIQAIGSRTHALNHVCSGV